MAPSRRRKVCNRGTTKRKSNANTAKVSKAAKAKATKQEAKAKKREATAKKREVKGKKKVKPRLESRKRRHGGKQKRDHRLHREENVSISMDQWRVISGRAVHLGDDDVHGVLYCALCRTVGTAT